MFQPFLKLNNVLKRLKNAEEVFSSKINKNKVNTEEICFKTFSVENIFFITCKSS